LKNGLKPNHFKIISVASDIASKIGIEKMYVSSIAKEMNVHHSLIYAYYKSMEEIRKKVIEKAIEEQCIGIIMDAIINKRIDRKQLSKEINEKVSNEIAGMFENENYKEKGDY
jgi:AcrR family transcriptional regulator